MKQAKNNSSKINFAASIALLILLFILVVFHLLIFVRFIPFDFIWGGKLKDTSQMYLFESVSMVISLIMIAVIGANAGIIKIKVQPVIIKVALWAMALLFLLNAIGNFNSESQFEKNVFAPITLLLSLLSFIIIFTKRKSPRKETR